MDATGRIHSRSRLHMRKRSLSLVGLLLPSLMTVEATPFKQHRVRAPKRLVSYSESREIPSDLTMLPCEPESKTRTIDGGDEYVWDLHVDALSHPSPDKAFDAIRRGHRTSVIQEETGAIRRTAVSIPSSSRRRGGSATEVPILGVVINETSLPPLDVNDTEGSFFNASLGMEYKVEINATTVSDSSSTIFATVTTENVDSTSEGSNDSPSATGRTNHTANFRPLRMRAFLSERAGGGQHLHSDQRTSLLLDMIKPALLSWSAALRVEPVVGQNLTVDRSQLVNGISCGPGGSLPSVAVPTEHITVGVADTDFILYVSLAFQRNQTKTSNKKTVYSALLNDTDVVSDDKKVCTGDYLAASAFCSTDQFDRPTAAILHLCIGDNFFETANINTNTVLVLHELGHALGFNAVSLAHFRRPDGTPYTERNEMGEIPLTETNCTGPVGHRKTEMIALPSTDVLNFRTVRGIRVAEIVTPSVRQVVRNHFDCQELPGAELESGEFLPLSTNSDEVSCLGDHWERRLFKTDLMNPIVDENVEYNPRFSSLTLAYFADSGWYQVDLSRTSISAGWGRAAGCAFVEETCIHIEDGQVPTTFNTFFCNEPPPDDSVSLDIQGCTTDMTRKASCSIDSYEGELPPEYQYFNLNYGANVGGTDAFMDYCPVYRGFANGLCSDSENEAVIKVNVIEKFGMRNSRCLSGTLNRRLSDGASSLSPMASEVEKTALCLPIACIVEDQSLRIQVDGEWRTCSRVDEIIEVTRSPVEFGDGVQESSEVISVICPDPIRICPTFYCNRDCLGTNRQCDYNVGKCVCNASKSTDYKTWNETSFAGMQYRIGEDENGICGAPNASAGGVAGDSRLFYQPEDQDDSGLPTPDSPLSAYYYDTESSLMEPDGIWSNRWKSITIGIVSGASLLLALLSYRVLRHRPRTTHVNEQGGGDDPDYASQEINPDKHKLMASIVVNIRMNDPYNRQQDAFTNRDSETDLSMTSEGTHEQPTLDDFLFEIPTGEFFDATMVDLSSCDEIASRLRQDDDDRDYIDPLAQPSTTPVFRRRRHMFSSSFL